MIWRCRLDWLIRVRKRIWWMEKNSCHNWKKNNVKKLRRSWWTVTIDLSTDVSEIPFRERGSSWFVSEDPRGKKDLLHRETRRNDRIQNCFNVRFQNFTASRYGQRTKFVLIFPSTTFKQSNIKLIPTFWLRFHIIVFIWKEIYVSMNHKDSSCQKSEPQGFIWNSTEQSSSKKETVVSEIILLKTT